MGYGPVDVLQARLRGVDDAKLIDVINWCQREEEEVDIEYPEDYEGDQIDWIYEQEREIRDGLDDYLVEMEKYYEESEDINVLTDYEKRVNGGK